MARGWGRGRGGSKRKAAEDTSNKGNKQSARGGNLVIPSNESIVIEDSDEDFEKAPTGATKQTNNSMNKPGTSTNTSVGTSTSAGFTDDNPKDDSSKANANATTATNNSGQPNIVMNATNITINVSPNSSTLDNSSIVISDDDETNTSNNVSVVELNQSGSVVARGNQVGSSISEHNNCGTAQAPVQSQSNGSRAKKKFKEKFFGSLLEHNNSRHNSLTTNSRSSVTVNANANNPYVQTNTNTSTPGVQVNTNTKTPAASQAKSVRGRGKKTPVGRGGRASAGSSQSKSRLSRKGAKMTGTGRFLGTSNYSSTGVSAAQGIVVGEPVTGALASAQAGAAQSTSQAGAAQSTSQAGAAQSTSQAGAAQSTSQASAAQSTSQAGAAQSTSQAGNVAQGVTQAQGASQAPVQSQSSQRPNSAHNILGNGSRAKKKFKKSFFGSMSKSSYGGSCDCPDCGNYESEEEYYSAEEELNNTVNILLGNTSNTNFVPRPSLGGAGPSTHLTSDEATQRMRSVFKKGLESKLNATQMEPCRGIVTPLHPHQKAALAWMCNQENKENQGMMGGILGDDMGLGKTLTIISLILTNHHDEKPLAKRSYGYIRPPIVFGKRTGGARKKTSILNPILPDPNVGKARPPVKLSSFKFFNLDKDDNKENRNEPSTSKGIKSKSGGKFKFFKSENLVESSSDLGSDSDFEIDDFDIMVKDSKTDLRSKIANAEHKTIVNPADEEKDEVYDEWSKMSQEQKDELYNTTMNPNLNMDGMGDSESEDDVQPARKKSKYNSISSDEDEKPKPQKIEVSGDYSSDSDDIGISDIDLDDDLPISSIPFQAVETPSATTDDTLKPKIESEPVKPKVSQDAAATNITTTRTVTSSISTSSVSSLQGGTPSTSRAPTTKISTTNFYPVNRIIPSKEPAVRGSRRRPTLIVCPTSLISHWCAEIDKHVESNINIKVHVHYGASKAQIGAELNACDIVITTYGTLAAEHDTDGIGPLMKAKWLRVVLDEGHYIKNHRTKTAKAAKELNTLRRWVVTGTPIQNNLLELWSLVHWLEFDLYSESMVDFKHEIERPCKNRQAIGFERLQTLMDTICLRRTKNDKKENGEPIVQLPTKTVIMRDVKFTEDEKFCYDLIKEKATEIVARYQKKGTLMRNYAHILVLMLRLRQMCCHRELVQEIDWIHTLHDKDELARQLVGMVEAEANLGGVNPDNPNDADHIKRLTEKLSQMIRDGVTEDCSICLEDLKSPVITLCSHVYCRECIERVIDQTKPPLCPLCRGNLQKKELLEASNPTLDDDDSNKKSEEDSLKALESISYNFSSNKVNGALKELIRIRQEAPEDKMIVVSQFTSFLSIIQPLLTKEGFKFVRLDGTMSQADRKETIEVFHTTGPNSPTVMLLSLKAGGVGLNLTSANHLLLMDPAWNPAAEWQCFDRIHRMGQTKDVFIYKFITVEGSIEETMLEIQERKKDIINGAFHMPDDERRRQRINEILTIFNLQPNVPAGAGPANQQLGGAPVQY